MRQDVRGISETGIGLVKKSQKWRERCLPRMVRNVEVNETEGLRKGIATKIITCLDSPIKQKLDNELESLA